MLLRVVVLDGKTGAGVFDWIPPELAAHLQANAVDEYRENETGFARKGEQDGGQQRDTGESKREPESGTEFERLRVCQLSSSSLYALLKVFIQFTRDMDGGAIRSIVFRAPMKNFEKRLLHNGVNSLEWAQSSGFFIALTGDTSENFLVGVAESKGDRVGDVLERFAPCVRDVLLTKPGLDERSQNEILQKALCEIVAPHPPA